MDVRKKFLQMLREYARLGACLRHTVLLGGQRGTFEQKADCGCILKAEHNPERRMWTFTMDYSNCADYKEHRSYG